MGLPAGTGLEDESDRGGGWRVQTTRCKVQDTRMWCKCEDYNQYFIIIKQNMIYKSTKLPGRIPETDETL